MNANEWFHVPDPGPRHCQPRLHWPQAAVFRSQISDMNYNNNGFLFHADRYLVLIRISPSYLLYLISSRGCQAMIIHLELFFRPMTIQSYICLCWPKIERWRAVAGLVSEWSLGQFVGKRTHDLYFNTTPAGLHSFLELSNFYINVYWYSYVVESRIFKRINSFVKKIFRK